MPLLKTKRFQSLCTAMLCYTHVFVSSRVTVLWVLLWCRVRMLFPSKMGTLPWMCFLPSSKRGSKLIVLQIQKSLTWEQDLLLAFPRCALPAEEEWTPCWGCLFSLGFCKAEWHIRLWSHNMCPGSVLGLHGQVLGLVLLFWHMLFTQHTFLSCGPSVFPGGVTVFQC